MPSRIDINNLVEEHGLDTSSTISVEIPGLNSNTHIFKVNRTDLIEELYIIDMSEGKDIACHPHLVGENLKQLSLEIGLEAAKAIDHLTKLNERKWDSIVFENVLRAAPGYELYTAFKQLYDGKGFRDIWIRTRYEKTSYRRHDEETSTQLRIVYEDFENLPRNRELIVLKPDTEATGRTGQKTIERIIERSEEAGSKVKELVLYGFISIPGLKLIKETASKYDVKLYALSIGNVTSLAYNGYDMPLYGVDESFWQAKKEIRKLGSIVDRTTLERYLPEFVPGADQPGDWSERQSSVYVTKDERQSGKISEHLQNSIRLIENLRKISDYTSWQDRIAEKELHLLRSTLKSINHSG